MSYAISIHVSEKEMMKLVRIKEYVTIHCLQDWEENIEHGSRMLMISIRI